MRIFMLACLLFLLQACYKDKGNYDLVDYSRVDFGTPVTGQVVVVGDTLRLYPVLRWKFPDRDTTNAFTYEWRESNTVISTEKYLTYVPKKTGLLMYYFFITEKATGIVVRQGWQVQVNSPYKAGWLMLTNNNGKSDLHYVRRNQSKNANNETVYDYSIFKNIYSSLFPQDQLGVGPKKLVTKTFTSFSDDEILIMQDSEPVFLNGASFAKSVNLKEDFVGGVYPKGAKPVDYRDGGTVNFVLFENGEVYWKRNAKTSGGIHEEQFIGTPMYFDNGGGNISGFIDNDVFKSSFLYMFDRQNDRFVSAYSTNGINEYIGNKMYIVNGTAPPAGFVDLNTMGGYKLVYSSDYSNSSYFMNIIKNTTTGEFLYQSYKTVQQLSMLQVTEHKQEAFAGNGLISDNTVYYRTYTSSYLFFGEGSKLYFYDVNTKAVKLYKDFGAGNITKITADANEGEVGVVLNDGRFCICSLKTAVLGESDPGATGILYEVAGLGDVIDLQWKWGAYSNYSSRKYP